MPIRNAHLKEITFVILGNFNRIKTNSIHEFIKSINDKSSAKYNDVQWKVIVECERLSKM